MVPEMLNLLGCSKENFIKLLKKMGYKTFEKDKDIYFRYVPKRIDYLKTKTNLKSEDNPFQKLANLNIK